MKQYESWIAQPKPKYLYHYTNSEAFLSIIQNKSLWASNIFFQNDISEISFSYDLLKDEMEKLENEYSELLECNIEFNKMQGIENIFKYEDIYTVSFSTKKDDLGQFRGYGHGSLGFSMEFNVNKVIEYLDKVSLSNKAFDYMFIKCIYEKGKQISIIQEIIKDVIDGKYSNKENILIHILVRMLLFAPIFKSDAFCEEDEWRLIIRNIKDIENCRERVGKLYFIPYYNLKFQNPECFGDFIIGPCADQNIVKHSVEKVCLNNGIDLLNRKIYLSSIPLRN